MVEPSPVAPQEPITPIAFITEDVDRNAKLYKAGDASGAELFAAFLSDGRVRIADMGEHRFAGMMENGHADLLDLANNGWSELFVRVAPSGQMQLELRGGPYDAHVFSCEPIA